MVQVITNTRELRAAGRQDPRRFGQLINEGTLDVTSRVTSFTYEDSEEEHDVLKLKVDNSDFQFFDHPAWLKGNLVRFSFGYPSRIFGPRTAIVDNVRGFRTLDITCVEEVALSNFAGGRLFENMTRGDVVKQLIEEQRFRGVSAFVIEEAPLVLEGKRDWSQARQTDWQFVQRLAEKVGFVAYVEGEKLHFHTRQLDSPPRRRFEYFFGDGDLQDFQVKEWRTTDRAAQTIVKGWNTLDREEVKATGSNENTETDTLGGTNTSDLPRKGSRPAGGEGANPPVDTLAGRRVVPTPEQRQATVTEEANAHFRAQQGEVKATAKIIGDPLLRAKNVVEITGVSRTLSGKYYITKHVHKITATGGYVGTLSLIKNALASVPSSEAPVLTQGKAKENAKPPPSDRRQVIVKGFENKLVQRRK